MTPIPNLLTPYLLRKMLSSAGVDRDVQVCACSCKTSKSGLSQCTSMCQLTPKKQKWVFMEYTIFNDHTIFNDPHPEFADSIFTPQNVDF